MLTHLIHFTMLDAFSAVVIWGLYTAISNHTKSDDNKSEVESATVEQDDDEDEEELFKPYHQTLYVGKDGMSLIEWQRACEQAENDCFGSVYHDYESGQIFMYTKNGLVKRLC